MKGKKAHRVPLTDQAVAILRARERGDADDYVFPGLKPGRPMSENTMLYFLQETEGDEVTVHGFRSSFSDWVREQTDFPKELAEAALARLTDLKDEPLIIFARSVNAPLYDQVVDRFRKEKVEPNFVYETAQAQIGLRIVGGGGGLMLGADYALREAGENISYVPLEGLPDLKVNIFWRSNESSGLVLDLVEILAERGAVLQG
jgi:hypothetical protein